MKPFNLRSRRGALAAASCCAAAAGHAQSTFATWASLANVKHLAGDFNGDRATDIAVGSPVALGWRPEDEHYFDAQGTRVA